MNHSQLSSHDLCIRAEEVIDESRTELLMFHIKRTLIQQRREAWQRSKPVWQRAEPIGGKRDSTSGRDQRFMRDMMEHEARRVA